MKSSYWTVWVSAILFWTGLVSPALAEQTGNHVQDMDEMTVTATKTSVAQELSPVTAYSVNREDLDCQPSYYMRSRGYNVVTRLVNGVVVDEDYATEIVYVNPGRYVECMMGVRYAF